ncbi:MAG: 4,5-dioxygenase [Gammaproteobacteria bacterium]|nr:4,5-dioxygenase [Gammaproteobacteria bacterium]
MLQINRPVNIHKAYHAHVYFDDSSLDLAARLTEEASSCFKLQLGRIHKKPIGPHPTGSRQLIFSSQQFDQLIPWLDQNRSNLSILIHGLTGNDLEDHTDYAYWLGDPVKLDLSKLGPPPK